MYFTASSPMASKWLSASTAGLIDATPKTLDIWRISCSLSCFLSARTKIRPSWRLTSTPSKSFTFFLILSTSIRSKYGLFIPFRATSPQRTIKIFCSFMFYSFLYVCPARQFSFISGRHQPSTAGISPQRPSSATVSSGRQTPAAVSCYLISRCHLLPAAISGSCPAGGTALRRSSLSPSRNPSPPAY